MAVSRIWQIRTTGILDLRISVGNFKMNRFTVFMIEHLTLMEKNVSGKRLGKTCNSASRKYLMKYFSYLQEKTKAVLLRSLGLFSPYILLGGFEMTTDEEQVIN